MSLPFLIISALMFRSHIPPRVGRDNSQFILCHWDSLHNKSREIVIKGSQTLVLLVSVCIDRLNTVTGHNSMFRRLKMALVSQSYTKIPYNHLNRWGKFHKIQYAFMLKVLNKLGKERSCLSQRKGPQ